MLRKKKVRKKKEKEKSKLRRQERKNVRKERTKTENFDRRIPFADLVFFRHLQSWTCKLVLMKHDVEV